MHASLARRTRASEMPVAPLLDARGASTILGKLPGEPVTPIAPSPCSLFGPRGAVLAAPDGPLFVCDTGHHRLLVWQRAPAADGVPADQVIGQADFFSEGRNAKGDIHAASLNVPTGIAVGGDVLAVADAWNHRVLLWHGLPRRSNQPADVVLGQADFAGTLANRGGERRADTMNWPYGVTLHEGRLYVADTGNRRVLAWDGVPQTNGAPADLVLEASLRWPHAIAARDERLFVADAGVGRVVVWRGWQFEGVRGEELGMPYGVAIRGDRLVVADTANSRLLGYGLDDEPARHIAGQPGLAATGENCWGPVGRDTLCWPYGVAACDSILVVADSGNNRVLLWNS